MRRMPQETHPAPEQIERFALGEAGSQESRLVVSHLLQGCPGCQKLARAAWYRTGSEEPRARAREAQELNPGPVQHAS